MKTMLFNPYTGTPRHPFDIASDPEGILIMDPEATTLEAYKAPQPEQNPFPHEAMDKVAAERYKVAKSVSTIWPYAVVAGDGNQELFHGGKSTCKHVARKLTGAFIDGAFYAQAQWQKELEASTCYMTNGATREECIRQAIEADRAQPERKPLGFTEMNQIVRDAQIKYCLDKVDSAEVAIIRAVEAHHGILPAPEEK